MQPQTLDSHKSSVVLPRRDSTYSILLMIINLDASGSMVFPLFLSLNTAVITIFGLNTAVITLQKGLTNTNTTFSILWKRNLLLFRTMCNS